jgi:hypothetical protein
VYGSSDARRIAHDYFEEPNNKAGHRGLLFAIDSNRLSAIKVMIDS